MNVHGVEEDVGAVFLSLGALGGVHAGLDLTHIDCGNSSSAWSVCHKLGSIAKQCAVMTETLS